MVTLARCLPAEVEAWLAERAQAGTVSLLSRHPFDAEYLLALKERGYQLFDAFVSGETMIFLDRERQQPLSEYDGYRLPGWDSVADATPLAYSLRWRRVGSYTILEGTAQEVAPQYRLFKLLAGERFWMWVSIPEGNEMPRVGAWVKVLGLCSWIGGVSTT